MNNTHFTLAELWNNPELVKLSNVTLTKDIENESLLVSYEDGEEIYLDLYTNGVLQRDNFSGCVYVLQMEDTIYIDNDMIYLGH